MNIKETLNLKAGTKLKCIYPHGCDFKEGETYEISDFTHDGCPTIFVNEGDCLPFIANGLSNEDQLIVNFGSSCAVFKIIEEDEAEKPNLQPGDYLKCETVKDDDVDFTVGKKYKIDAYATPSKKAFVVDGDDSGTWHITIKDGEIVMAAGGVEATFSKAEDANEYDFNIGDKLTCVESERVWFTKDKEYPIDALKITADGLHFVYIKDDDGNSTGIDVTSSNSLHADDCRFVKSDSIKKPTPDEIMDSLLEDGPHFAAVSDFFKNPTEYSEASYALIVSTNDKSDYRFVDTNGEQWKYAVAVDARGNVIKDLAPKATTPSEIMEALLKNGPVEAWVDDESHARARRDEYLKTVTGVNEYGWYETTTGSDWKYAVPVDDNDKEITEL